MHQLLRSLSHALSGPLRLGSHWLLATAKEMQAKIGQLALEVDFLEVALGRVGDASAKR